MRRCVLPTIRPVRRGAGRPLVILAAVVLPIGLTSCSGADADPIVAAGERTVAAGTARIAMTTIIDAGVGEAKQRLDGGGLVDFGRRASQLEVRVGPPQQASTGISSEGGVSVLINAEDEQTFVRFASWAAERPWNRLPAGEDVGGQGLGPPDLAAQLQLLTLGLVSLEELGEEEVRGEPTTHYRVSIDLDEAARDASDDQRQVVDLILAGQADRQFDLDVWVGEEYVHRLSHTVDVPAAAIVADGSAASEGPMVGAGATVTTVTEYFDLGVPFSFEMPENAVEATTQAPEPTTE